MRVKVFFFRFRGFLEVLGSIRKLSKKEYKKGEVEEKINIYILYISIGLSNL